MSSPAVSRSPVKSASSIRASLVSSRRSVATGSPAADSRHIVLGGGDILPPGAVRGSSARRSRTRATRRPPSISGCGATAGRDARRSRFRTGRSRPPPGARGSTNTSPPRRRRAPATSPRAPSLLSGARSDRARADTARRVRARRRSARRRCSRQSATLCCGSHIMRSRLTLSNPAARASSTAARARSAEWIRPSRRSSDSRNDCTPKLMRLTPASRKPAMRAAVEVSGLVSSVISASRATSKVSRHAVTSRAISAGSSSDGVPPPKKIVSAAPPARRSDLALERRDVPVLQPGLEQPAVEVAVVADGTAERDVQVEPEHDNGDYEKI